MYIETNATFRIVGDDVDPDAISAEMGLPADESHRPGDVHGKRTRIVRKQGYWALVSSKHIKASDDTEQHLRWLVSALTGKRERTGAYKSRGWTVDIILAIHTDVGYGGPTLSPGVLAEVAALGLDVGLDLYPDS